MISICLSVHANAANELPFLTGAAHGRRVQHGFRPGKRLGKITVTTAAPKKDIPMNRAMRRPCWESFSAKMATVSAANCRTIHYTDGHKDQHKAAATDDTIKPVVNPRAGQSSVRGSLVHKKTHRRATMSQTNVLEQCELVNTSGDKYGPAEPCGVAAGQQEHLFK